MGTFCVCVIQLPANGPFPLSIAPCCSTYGQGFGFFVFLNFHVLMVKGMSKLQPLGQSLICNWRTSVFIYLRWAPVLKGGFQCFCLTSEHFISPQLAMTPFNFKD
ncbi:hypothetical protein XENTR_v10004213 [Xenopus tropicalis]|nr:hypothetical protein XENTR_v10004213 [Xenopus tropicalis]